METIKKMWGKMKAYWLGLASSQQWQLIATVAVLLLFIKLLWPF